MQSPELTVRERSVSSTWLRWEQKSSAPTDRARTKCVEYLVERRTSEKKNAKIDRAENEVCRVLGCEDDNKTPKRTELKRKCAAYLVAMKQECAEFLVAMRREKKARAMFPYVFCILLVVCNVPIGILHMCMAIFEDFCKMAPNH